MKFNVYRDCDTLRLRKVVIELWQGDKLLDRRRMFGLLGLPMFARRLARKKARMLRLAALMVAGSGEVK